MQKYITPAFWIIVFQLIGGALGFLTSRNIEPWYDGLVKSSLNPPDITFSIVWPVLYVMLALAGWMMWNARKDAGEAFRLFWMQMFLNWGWSFVFFEFKLVLIGFVWITALNLAMAAFIYAAWEKHRTAALLVVPTLLWGCFAAYLNYTIWVLN